MTVAIKFGTDGWRGIIADDFTLSNTARVSGAVARYLVEKRLAAKGLVIGYDTRFMAEDFALRVAQVVSSYGIPVYMTDKASPTPVTAYSILDKKAAGAVMLTASHNPPKYSGFKFIPEYAGPATPEITDRIVELISEGEEQYTPQPQLIQTFDPRPAYYKFLARQVDLTKIQAAGIPCVVNPMHGAGIGYLEEILGDLGLSLTVQRDWRDPLYGGTMPEPKPELLIDMQEAILEGAASLGLALDGDADRFGIIDETGHYLLPNELLCLLAEYLLSVRGLKGPIARTVSTTTLLDRIACHHGVEIIETPVGFKYQGQAMLNQGAILAGEESGGLSIKGHIPEKDGILACLLAAEMTAHYNKPLSQVYQELTDVYGRVFTRRLDFHCSQAEKEAALARLKEYRPEKIAQIPVSATATIDGWKYTLADGSWLLVRASGTEAVFRIYCESDTPAKLDILQNYLAGELGF